MAPHSNVVALPSSTSTGESERRVMIGLAVKTTMRLLVEYMAICQRCEQTIHRLSGAKKIFPSGWELWYGVFLHACMWHTLGARGNTRSVVTYHPPLKQQWWLVRPNKKSSEVF